MNHTITLTAEQAEAFKRGESITLTPPNGRKTAGDLKIGDRFKHRRIGFADSDIFRVVGTYEDGGPIDASKVFPRVDHGSAIVIVDPSGYLRYTGRSTPVIPVNHLGKEI